MKLNRKDFIKLSAAGLPTVVLSGSTFALLDNKGNSKSKLYLNKSQDMYKTYLWIELIGFDNTQKDFGVKEFLNTTGFVPEAISFLFSDSDFINTHQGMNEEQVFPPGYCSYNGRPYSRLRNRQDWTNYQLRGLTQELQKYGVAVYFSFFDFVKKESEEQWGFNHPEVWETGKEGNKYPAIHPLKRLMDGSFYEDFLTKKLIEVFDDYGFDGFHIPDGVAHTRRPIHDVDYSDDMVDQFLNQSEIKLPFDLVGQFDTHERKYIQRSKWIWQNKKQEWILFHVERWERFYKKIVSQIHKKGKKIIMNSAWTRAPFEAIYRYGIDYRRIANTGVDGFVLENVAAAVSMEPRLSDEHIKINSIMMAMTMLIKAEAPDTPLMPFTPLHDTTEQYDALRHIPTVVEREIYTFANLYLYDENAKPVRCSSGPTGCLSDSLYDHEWEWLKKRWDLGFSSLPISIGGMTLIWSNKASENQLNDYIKTRRWSMHKLLYELIEKKAPVYSTINIDFLHNCKGPILILNPNLFPLEELESVLAYKNGSIIMIGGKVELSKKPDYQFEDIYSSDSLFCAIYHLKEAFEVKLNEDHKEDIPKNYDTIPEPHSWTESLYYRKVSDGFIQGCADAILICTEEPDVLSEKDSVHVMTIKYSENVLRLLIGNDSHYYATPQIEMKNIIDKITIKTPFPGVPVVFKGKEFHVRIPGRGMVVLDINLK